MDIDWTRTIKTISIMNDTCGSCALVTVNGILQAVPPKPRKQVTDSTMIELEREVDPAEIRVSSGPYGNKSELICKQYCAEDPYYSCTFKLTKNDLKNALDVLEELERIHNENPVE